MGTYEVKLYISVLKTLCNVKGFGLFLLLALNRHLFLVSLLSPSLLEIKKKITTQQSKLGKLFSVWKIYSL
jgi:hypothetical protein